MRLRSRSPQNPALFALVSGVLAWVLALPGGRGVTIAADAVAIAGGLRGLFQSESDLNSADAGTWRIVALIRRTAVASLLAVAMLSLAIHVVSWCAAAVVVGKSLQLPPIQSVCALGASAVFLLVTAWAPRRWRTSAAAAALVLFGALTVAVPLDVQFAGTGFMGDGVDFAQHREKFVGNIPVAGGDPQIHFKSHLADAFLAAVDGTFGRTEESPAIAYRWLSHLGGLLFLLELWVVLRLTRVSRRACRYVGLMLATPVALTFFGYYETGYMAATAAAFPLLLRGIRSRSQSWSADASGGLQGVHAAFHGFGLIGMAGGIAAALRAPRRPISIALRYAAFALAAYLIWVLLYVVVWHLSIEADTYSSSIAFRPLTMGYYFDRRLVHPLLSWNAIAEIGCASLAVGVPLLVLGLLRSRRSLERTIVLLYASAGLVFLIVWWPSAGVSRDLDLLLSAFAGIGGAVWLLSRTSRSTAYAWVLLIAVHVAFWSAIADRTLDRMWLQ
jgi:hypothetical protein